MAWLDLGSVFPITHGVAKGIAISYIFSRRLPEEKNLPTLPWDLPTLPRDLPMLPQVGRESTSL